MGPCKFKYILNFLPEREIPTLSRNVSKDGVGDSFGGRRSLRSRCMRRMRENRYAILVFSCVLNLQESIPLLILCRWLTCANPFTKLIVFPQCTIIKYLNCHGNILFWELFKFMRFSLNWQIEWGIYTTFCH